MQTEGTLSANRAGYGFVRTDALAESVFLPPPEMRGLMHGDRVRIEVRSDGQGRYVGTGARGARARCAGVSGHGRGRLPGTGGAQPPTSGSALHCAVADNPAEARAGDWVIARVLRYPSDGQQGEARVEQRLDPERPVQMATEAAIARFGLPVEFSAAALREAAHWGKSVDPAEAAQRIDLRALPLVTIDGADAKDFDDAVYAERREGGGFRLTGRDRRCQPLRASGQRARYRGARARHLGIFPDARAADAADGAVEPPVLARASGGPVVHGRGHAHLQAWNARGQQFYPAVMRSAARLTYNQAHDALFLGVPAARAALGSVLEALLPLVERLSRAAGRAPQARRTRIRCAGGGVRDRERRARARHRIHFAQRRPQADRGMHGAGQCRGGAGVAQPSAAGAVSRARRTGREETRPAAQRHCAYWASSCSCPIR